LRIEESSFSIYNPAWLHQRAYTRTSTEELLVLQRIRRCITPIAHSFQANATCRFSLSPRSTTQFHDEDVSNPRQRHRMGASSRAPRVTFVYPALPELKLCLAVNTVALIYGIYCVFQASQNYVWSIGDYGVLSSLPFIGPVMKDQTSWEWVNWSPFAWHYLPVFMSHTVVFNLGTKLLAETSFTIIYTLGSIAACVYYFSPTLVALSIAQGTIMFVMCHFFRQVYYDCTILMFSYASLKKK
ncbi:hypothetical protein ANCCAN_10948, partial [Ancylostoma caninum]